MNYFGAELDRIITDRKLSNSKAAKTIGIDPTLLRRYRNGERTPRDIKFIDKIQSGLSLSDKEVFLLEQNYKLQKNPLSVRLPDQNNELKAVIIELLMAQKKQKELLAVSEMIPDSIGDISDNHLYPIRNAKDLADCMNFINAGSDKIRFMTNLSEEVLSVFYTCLLPFSNQQQKEYLFFLNNTYQKTSLLTDFLGIAFYKSSEKKQLSRFHILYAPDQPSMNRVVILTNLYSVIFEIGPNEKLSDISIRGFLTKDKQIHQYYTDILEYYRSHGILYGESSNTKVTRSDSNCIGNMYISEIKTATYLSLEDAKEDKSFLLLDKNTKDITNLLLKELPACLSFQKLLTSYDNSTT